MIIQYINKLINDYQFVVINHTIFTEIASRLQDFFTGKKG